MSKSELKLVCKVNIVHGNLKFENPQDYAQKPQRNCTFMNSASVMTESGKVRYASICEKVANRLSSTLLVHKFMRLNVLSNDNRWVEIVEIE